MALLLYGCLAKSMVRQAGMATAARPEKAVATPTATPAPEYPQAAPVEQGKPVVINSRHLRYNNQTQETVFTGKVTVRQGTTLLRADTLTAQAKGEEAQACGNVEVEDAKRKVRLKSRRAEYGNQLKYARLRDDVWLNTVDPYGRPVTVTSDEALYHTAERQATLTGRVKVFRQDITATAQVVDYDGEAGILRLRQGARVRKGANRFKADSIEFLNKENRIRMQGQVRAVFIPEEIEAATERR
jgi:lipopolysaccharide transport protein LptA